MDKKETFEIGALIHEQLSPMIQTFPIIAEQGSPYPFVVYRRSSMAPRRVKCNTVAEDDVTVEITVAAATYTESLELGDKIRQKLERLRGRWRDVIVQSIVLTNASERFTADAYLQQLYFTFNLDYSLNN